MSNPKTSLKTPNLGIDQETPSSSEVGCRELLAEENLRPVRQFSERLRVARALRKITTRDLAKECGVSAAAISKYEKEKAMPCSKNLLAISDALDIPIDWFFDNGAEFVGQLLVTGKCPTWREFYS